MPLVCGLCLPWDMHMPVLQAASWDTHPALERKVHATIERNAHAAVDNETRCRVSLPPFQVLISLLLSSYLLH